MSIIDYLIFIFAALNSFMTIFYIRCAYKDINLIHTKINCIYMKVNMENHKND